MCFYDHPALYTIHNHKDIKYLVMYDMTYCNYCRQNYNEYDNYHDNQHVAFDASLKVTTCANNTFLSAVIIML